MIHKCHANILQLYVEGGGGGGVKAGKQGICLVYRNECAQVEQGINSKYPMVVVNCVVMW